jgi:hypothetical protein
MKTMLLLATAIVFGFATKPAFAAEPSTQVTRDAVGSWVYDQSGQIVGSLRSLTDHGHKATVMVGSYLTPGSHLMTIPTDILRVVNGRVTVESEAATALLSTSPSGFAG